MKHTLLVFALLLGVAWPVYAGGDAIVSSTCPGVDAAWAELKELGLLEAKYPANYGTMSRREQSEWRESQALLLRKKGTSFIERFEADLRRWTVAWRMIQLPPRFILSYGPNHDKDYRDVVVDAPAVAAWQARLAQLESAMDSATDLPAEVRESLEYRKLAQTVSQAVAMTGDVKPPDWSAVSRAVLIVAAKYPASQYLAFTMRNAIYAYEANHRPEESAAAWRPLIAAANAPLAELAREKVRAFEAISGPLELTFTAVDGREVDVKKLRGKVVLVEFWATWCGPCMAEMPNVKRVYAAYHDWGFEIIGVSCDIAPGADAPKGRATRSAAQLIEFKEKNGMPWPDYYDGRKHNEGGNALAKRFGITGIPASFLLDREGRVVALNLKGEKLEQEVRRLLAL